MVQLMVRELQAVVLALQEQVREFQARLNQNSSNSSRPPSSDPPWRQRQKKPRTGRKRGGQRGHPGSCRRLLRERALDHVLTR
jgi:transposase